jgi:excinuclease ABC subunit A
LAELKKAARKRNVRMDVPWAELTDAEKEFVISGSTDADEGYSGIRGFFRWLERKKYKVHVRVFLSRYRGYLTCPDCGGARLRKEARDVKIAGQTIDRVSSLTVQQAAQFFATLELSEKDHHRGKGPEIRRRLSFLTCRARLPGARRLSSPFRREAGGSTWRHLGSALTGHAVVLDGPSIDLHSATTSG